MFSGAGNEVSEHLSAGRARAKVHWRESVVIAPMAAGAVWLKMTPEQTEQAFPLMKERGEIRNTSIFSDDKG